MTSVDKVLYLSKTDVEKLDIHMKAVINVVEEAFRQKAEGKAEVPPKPGIPGI